MYREDENVSAAAIYRRHLEEEDAKMEELRKTQFSIRATLGGGDPATSSDPAPDSLEAARLARLRQQAELDQAAAVAAAEKRQRELAKLSELLHGDEIREREEMERRQEMNRIVADKLAIKAQYDAEKAAAAEAERRAMLDAQKGKWVAELEKRTAAQQEALDKSLVEDKEKKRAKMIADLHAHERREQQEKEDQERREREVREKLLAKEAHERSLMKDGEEDEQARQEAMRAAHEAKRRKWLETLGQGEGEQS